MPVAKNLSKWLKKQKADFDKRAAERQAGIEQGEINTEPLASKGSPHLSEASLKTLRNKAKISPKRWKQILKKEFPDFFK